MKNRKDGIETRGGVGVNNDRNSSVLCQALAGNEKVVYKIFQHQSEYSLRQIGKFRHELFCITELRNVLLSRSKNLPLRSSERIISEGAFTKTQTSSV